MVSAMVVVGAQVRAATTTIADTIDQILNEQRHQTRTVIKANSRPRNLRALAHKPPLAATGSGCLLTIATNLLSIADPAQAAVLIPELLRQDTTNSIWTRLFVRAHNFCSPGLRAAVTDYARTQEPKPTGRRPGWNRPVTDTTCK